MKLVFPSGRCRTQEIDKREGSSGRKLLPVVVDREASGPSLAKGRTETAEVKLAHVLAFVDRGREDRRKLFKRAIELELKLFVATGNVETHRHG